MGNSFYKELLGFLFLDALPLKTAIKYHKNLIPSSPSLAAECSIMTTRDAALICEAGIAGMASPFQLQLYVEFSQVGCLMILLNRLLMLSEALPESMWASSLLLFAGALSSQFLTECVNLLVPAGRTLELNPPPTL